MNRERSVILAETAVLWRIRFIEYLVDEHGWPRDRAAESLLEDHPAL